MYLTPTALTSMPRVRIEKTDMNAWLRGCFQLQGVRGSGDAHILRNRTRQWNERLGTAITSLCTWNPTVE
ncbi:unnamed protein product [Prunus armeniaca]